MRKFLFRNPPEVFALFIAIPILVHLVYIQFFGYPVNMAIVAILVIEACILFHIYVLLRDVNPAVVYLSENSNRDKKNINDDYDDYDIKLIHLQQWYDLSCELDIPEMRIAFSRLIDDFIVDQKYQSTQKKEGENDTDGDIPA